MGLDGGVGKRDGGNLVAVGLGRNHDAAAHLAVDLHRQFDFVVNQPLLVEGGEVGIGDGVVVAQSLPQFLSNMGGDRGDHNDDRGDGCPRHRGGGEMLGQEVYVLDRLGHHGVEPQVFVVVPDAGDGAVECLGGVVVKLSVGDGHIAGFLVHHQAPQALQEPLCAHNILGGPGA